MDKFIVHGGVPLQGEVRIGGAKNAVLAQMAVCLLAPGKSTPKNSSVTIVTKIAAPMPRPAPPGMVAVRVGKAQRVSVMIQAMADIFLVPRW